MHYQQLVPILASLLLAPASSLAQQLRCENVLLDGHSFDFSKLAGPHSVVTSRYESIPDTHFNTTYTLDLCHPLKKSGKEKTTEQCPTGSRVCAIRRFLSGDNDIVDKVVAISGALENYGGSQFDYDLTRLKNSDSDEDAQKEGVRIVFKGGKHPLDGPVKERRPQRAVVELLCDPDKEGTEGEWESEDKYENENNAESSKLRARDDKEDEDDSDNATSSIEHQLKKDNAALVWDSYGPEKDADVLRLRWYTKHACEKRDESGDTPEKDGSSHWGFFTWFVIICFLGIAAYLIFGSWLNYNRYGATGWDLVPHGDTIRDVPYLLKDWTRSVLNTVQGTGSRGGYSAV